MWGKIHLFLVMTFLKPIYKSNNGVFLFFGEVLRKCLIFLFKCDLSPSAIIPSSTKFPHYIGIVIAACKIGENCFIRQNTTIGGKYSSSPEAAKKRARSPMWKRRITHPIIGSNVDIGVNVCILGPINIGSNSIIGAGSVVVKDVEPYSVYAGVPAKKLRNLPRPDSST